MTLEKRKVTSPQGENPRFRFRLRETTESRVRDKAPDNRNEREFTTDQLGLIMTEYTAL